VNNNTWLEELLTALSNNVVLERLFFTSIELAVLAFAVWLITRVKLARSPRVIAILWFAVMARALTGLVMTPPLALALIDRPDTPIARPSSPIPELPKDETPRPPSTAATQILKPPPSAPIPDAHVPARKHLVPAFQMPELGVAGWIYILWICGVTLLTFYTCVGRVRLWVLVRKSAAPSETLATMYSNEAHAMGLRVIPRLCVTDKLESPAIAGVLRPVVLFPQWLAESADHEKLTWAARHELMHWKLGDPVVHTLRIVVQILFFFHPASWWVGKRWEESAELACDRALIRSQSEVIQYAEQLFAMLALIGARRQRALASGLYATRNSVSTRITALLAEPLRVPARIGLRSAIALALFTMLVLGIGGRFAERKAVAQIQPGSAIAAPAVLPARVLHFPDDRSIGTVQFGRQTVEARGTVSVPEGASVYLHVSETGVTDLSPLAAFGENDLQEISLAYTSVQDNDLAYIQHMTGLQRLELSSTGIGNEGMYYLQDLNNLTRLNLNATHITDEGLQYVQNMTHMNELILNRTNVGDEGMQYLSNMKDLVFLDLWQADITDEGMRQLQNLTNMQELGIEDTKITDAGLDYLAAFAVLGLLNIENTDITNEGLAKLASLPSLKQLGLEDTLIDDNGVALLAQFKALQEIQLPIQISPEAIHALKGLPVFNSVQALLQSRKTEVAVVDRATRRAIAGASFSLEPTPSNPEQEVHFHHVRNDGRAMVYRPMQEQGARIRAFADGYVTGEESWNEPVPARVEIALDKASPIGGIVLDAAGAPVHGATVSVPVLGSHNWDSEENLPHRETTDAEGRWVCDIAPQSLNDFWIALDHPEHATTTYTMAELSVAALHNLTQELRIADAIDFKGIVVNEENGPVANVRIAEIEPWRRGSIRASGKSAVTNTSGAFEIANVKPGALKLKITAKGYVPIAKDFEAAPDASPTRIVLSSTTILRGRVVDEKKGPVANAHVYAEPQDDSDPRVGGWSGITDEAGKFEWSEAPKEPSHMTIGARGYKRASVSLAPGEKEHEIILESQSMLAKVIDAATGQPVQNFTVLFGINKDDDRGNFGRLSQQVRDAAGQFTPVPDGLFNEGTHEGAPIILKTMFGVRAKGYYLSKALPVELSKSASASSPSVTIESDKVPVEFRLEPGPPITGRVLAQDGKPLANARVVVASEEFPINANWAAQSNPVTVRAEVTDGNGNFAASPERAPYVVCVYADDGYAVVTDVELKEKSDITVKPWASLSVSLKGNPPGKAVPVRISQKNSFYKVEHIVSAKDKNELLFDHVMPGEVAVDVASYSRSKYESVPVTV